MKTKEQWYWLPWVPSVQKQKNFTFAGKGLITEWQLINIERMIENYHFATTILIDAVRDNQ